MVRSRTRRTINWTRRAEAGRSADHLDRPAVRRQVDVPAAGVVAGVPALVPVGLLETADDAGPDADRAGEPAAVSVAKSSRMDCEGVVESASAAWPEA